LEEVINLQPDYIDWCAKNLDHFYLSNEVIDEIKAVNPDFQITQEALETLNTRYENWENEYYDNFEPDYYRDTFDALTDGLYGDYDAWRENGGEFDSLMDGLGH
jgi:hypothetical protein